MECGRKSGQIGIGRERHNRVVDLLPVIAAIVRSVVEETVLEQRSTADGAQTCSHEASTARLPKLQTESLRFQARHWPENRHQGLFRSAHEDLERCLARE